jgi:hypothetical protein
LLQRHLHLPSLLLPVRLLLLVLPTPLHWVQ